MATQVDTEGLQLAVPHDAGVRQYQKALQKQLDREALAHDCRTGQSRIPGDAEPLKSRERSLIVELRLIEQDAIKGDRLRIPNGLSHP